jgi:PhzF family phenazine biosynthesis protein
MKIFQVDAFADKVFAGNPAAVCPLDKFLPDNIMQDIAMENNLAETAFFVKTGGEYQIRWFTPTIEVDLCGHATLASAHVLFNHLDHNDKQINFRSHRSGALKVYKNNGLLTLDFPVDTLTRVEPTPELLSAFSVQPMEIWRGKTDLMYVFKSEALVRDMEPDFRLIAKLPCRGVIVTAKGDNVDFVSRFFGPQSGIDEDPATGSAHTTLTPYWSKQLNKKELSARQLSHRGASLHCADKGDRIFISGGAKTYMVGDIAW